MSSRLRGPCFKTGSKMMLSVVQQAIGITTASETVGNNKHQQLMAARASISLLILAAPVKPLVNGLAFAGPMQHQESTGQSLFSTPAAHCYHCWNIEHPEHKGLSSDAQWFTVR